MNKIEQQIRREERQRAAKIALHWRNNPGWEAVCETIADEILGEPIKTPYDYSRQVLLRSSENLGER